MSKKEKYDAVEVELKLKIDKEKDKTKALNVRFKNLQMQDEILQTI
jgi:hypothetical protein